MYSCHLFLISSASVRSLPFQPLIVSVFARNIPIVSQVFLKKSLVFPILLFSSISLHCSLKKAFLSFLAIIWNPIFSWVHLSLSPLPFVSLLFSTILMPLRQPLCLLTFLFLRDGFGYHFLYNVMNLSP